MKIKSVLAYSFIFFVIANCSQQSVRFQIPERPDQTGQCTNPENMKVVSMLDFPDHKDLLDEPFFSRSSVVFFGGFFIFAGLASIIFTDGALALQGVLYMITGGSLLEKSSDGTGAVEIDDKKVESYLQQGCTTIAIIQ